MKNKKIVLLAGVIVLLIYGSKLVELKNEIQAELQRQYDQVFNYSLDNYNIGL